MERILRKTPSKQYSTIYVIFEDLVEKMSSENKTSENLKEPFKVEAIDLTCFYFQ